MVQIKSAKDAIGLLKEDGAQVDAQLERMIEDLEAPDTTSLTSFIESAYHEAKSHRESIGVDAQLKYCEYSAQSKYTEEERQRLGITDKNDIYAPITATKVIALESWLRDVFVNAEERPWTLEPTEYPDLPSWMENRVLAQVAEEFALVGDNADPEAVADRLRELKALALPEAKRMAKASVERAEKFIEDQLQEGGFRAAFSAFVHDISIFPNAFIKGPFVTHQTKLMWEGGNIVAKDVPAMTVTHVSPYNVFPSPNSLDPQGGAYIFERMFLSANELSRLAELNDAERYGYKPDEIRALLAEHAYGWLFADTSPDEVGLDDTGTQIDRKYEIAVYYGYVPVSVIEEHVNRKLSSDVEDIGDVRHVEVWYCGGRILRIAEIKRGRPRPIHTTSFKLVPESFWGMSPPLVLKEIQRGANACLRSLVVNMAYSSGPIFEIDGERLELEEDITTIEPWRIFQTTQKLLSQVTAQPAIQMHTIDSRAGELLRVYDRFEKMADDASGIPAYVIGAPQVAGAGRTLGGLALLMGNAAKGIKRVVSNIDKQVIEPLVSGAYLQLALVTDDKSLLADARVKARGASGLLQRELTQSRAIEVLQLLTPYVQAGAVPQETITVLLRDIVASLGFSADELVPDVRRAADIQAYFPAQMPQASQQLNVAPDVLAQLQGGGLSQAPQVQLDQRSQPPANPMDEAKLPQS